MLPRFCGESSRREVASYPNFLEGPLEMRTGTGLRIVGTGVLARRFGFAGLKFLRCVTAQSKATGEDARFTLNGERRTDGTELGIPSAILPFPLVPGCGYATLRRPLK